MQKKLYALLAFMTGFTALIYQVYGFQVLFLFFVNSSRSAAISTSSFLLGMAAASLVFSRMATRENAMKILFVLNGLLLLYACLVLKNYQWIPSGAEMIGAWLQNNAVKETLKLFNFWLFLFIPAFFVGSIFPLISGLYVRENAIFQGVGRLYFWDTLGAAIGALATGFVFIPFYGLKTTIDIALTFSLLIQFGLYLLSGTGKAGRVFLVLTIVLYAANFLYHSDRAFDRYLVQDDKLNQRFGRVLFRQTSPYGLVTVGEKDGVKILFVNYREMCRTARAGDTVASNIMASEAVKLAGKGDVLNIGLGCGFTAMTLAQSSLTDKVEVAEINPVIRKATKKVFGPENGHLTENPKIDIVLQDGAAYLKETKKQYSAIVIDIEEASVIYSSPLYTKEYFQVMKQRLKPGGVLALWSFNVGPEFHKALYNTFKAVFPYVRVQFFPGSLNFYASDRPISLTLTPDVKQSDAHEKELLSFPEKEINTLDHRILEKLYSSNANFSLPQDYKEEFVRP